MADWYVDSNATGSPTDGLTWDTAFHTLAAAAAVESAGDTIWVASDHSESTAGAVTLTWSGTQASPVRIISADKTSGEPPSTLQAGAIVATSGANAITGNNSNSGNTYYWGITFRVGVGTSLTANFNGNTNSSRTTYENCSIELAGTNASSEVKLNQAITGRGEYVNCTFKFGATGQGFGSASNGADGYVYGGSIDAAGSAITTIVKTMNSSIRMDFIGVDLSAAASSADLVSASSAQGTCRFIDCKLPASWSGSVQAGTMSLGQTVSMQNCAGGDVNYAMDMERLLGSIVHETTLVKSGGASDGTTSISWEMTTNANAEWSHQTLDSPEIVRWNETTGSSVTLTVDILHDGAQIGSPDGVLTDQDIWLDVQYLGTSGFPLSLFADDAAATYTTTAADQASSSASWTTTGMSNPVTQKLSVTVTPQEEGFFHAKIKLAKASYVVYLDPLLQVS